MATPTEAEVKAAVDAVYDQVADLMATPEGYVMMKQARNEYVGHEE